MVTQRSVRILIVEDNTAFRAMLSETLEGFGYQVEAFESAETTLTSWTRVSDIALLDINLPGEDGLYLAQQLRIEKPTIGIIMMTVRNQVADKVAGYDAGADVYLPKPIAPVELNAAIKAISRRILSDTAELTLIHASMQLFNKDQQIVNLTSDECRLLTALAVAQNRYLEYWELAEKLDLDLDSDTLRANLEKRVSRLRKKLMQLELPPTTVKAIRGMGYKLSCDVLIS